MHFALGGGGQIVSTRRENHTTVSRRWPFVAAVLCALLVLSCADHGPEESLTPSQPADRFGMIVVSRSPSPVPGVASEDLRVTGFFVRHAGFDKEQVLDLMNLTDAPDPSMFRLQVGDCQLTERQLSDGIDTRADAFVDLIDAGDVRLDLEGRGSARLRRRAFPDLFSNVGGVTYDATPLDGVATGDLRVVGRGSRQVGDFMVSLQPAPIPVLRSVDGQPITSNYAAVDWRESLELEWSPPSGDVPRQTQTYIELAALQYDRIVALRCRAEDTGRARLPRAGVEAVGRLATVDATVRLSVRRLVHQRFAAAGLHDGDAFYVSRDSVLLK